MTHEFKKIVENAFLEKQKGLKSVLASVVALDGSSYRRPGVRMLILENGEMIGAVSGGCVEKEIVLQSETVFKTGISKMMTYDGRYRLGCEGILYILIEPFRPSEKFQRSFATCLRERNLFEIISYFKKKEGPIFGLGSFVKLNNEVFTISGSANEKDKNKASSMLLYSQKMPPCFKLVIIGTEHDAVELCKFAAFTGWEVTIISGFFKTKSIINFSGAHDFYNVSAEQMNVKTIDNQTAVVLMTHNFANDLRYLMALKETNPVYIGLLGPTKRREDLLTQFIEYCPDIEDEFLERIHGPAGINIGAETPQEIAISIISEILAIVRKQEPIALKNKQGSIHARHIKT